MNTLMQYLNPLPWLQVISLPRAVESAKHTRSVQKPNKQKTSKKNRWMVCFIVSMALTPNLGCGMFNSANTGPRVQYANPDHEHVRDLPVNKYNTDAKEEDEEKPPLSVAQYQHSGDRMLAKGNYYLAFMNYEKALAMAPGDTVLKFKKALTCLAAHKNKDALKQFRDIVKKQPDFAMAYEGIGIASFRLQKFIESEKAFKRTLILDPASWKSHNFLGAIFDIRKNYPEAIKAYKAALSIRPGAGFIYNNLGVSYSLAEDYPHAVQAYDRAIQLGYTPKKIYNNLGLALVKMDRYGEALDNFRKGGTEARAYNNLGCGYLSRGNLNEAADCFEKAVCLDPSYYVLAGENLTRTRRALSTDTIP